MAISKTELQQWAASARMSVQWGASQPRRPDLQPGDRVRLGLPYDDERNGVYTVEAREGETVRLVDGQGWVRTLVSIGDQFALWNGAQVSVDVIDGTEQRHVSQLPELHPGVRVQLRDSARVWGDYTIAERDLKYLRLRHASGLIRVDLRGDGAYCPVSGKRLHIEVIDDEKQRTDEHLRPDLQPGVEQAKRKQPRGPFDDEVVKREPTLRERYCARSCGKLNAEPHLHADGCPVAPAPGLHGGMRETPVAAGCVVRWVPSHATHNGYDAGGVLVSCIDLHGQHTSGAMDMVLMAFYLPPAQPTDEPARLPVDGDAELEGVAARATHDAERWNAVTR